MAAIIQNLQTFWESLQSLRKTNIVNSVDGRFDMVFLRDINVTLGKSKYEQVFYVFPGQIRNCKQWLECKNHATIFVDKCYGHITLYMENNYSNPNLDEYFIQCKNYNCKQQKCIYIGFDLINDNSNKDYNNKEYIIINKIINKELGYIKFNNSLKLMLNIFNIDGVIISINQLLRFIEVQNICFKKAKHGQQEVLKCPQHNPVPEAVLQDDKCFYVENQHPTEYNEEEQLSELLALLNVRQCGSGLLANYKEKIKNPFTGRYIYSSGKTAKKLIKMYNKQN